MGDTSDQHHEPEAQQYERNDRVTEVFWRVVGAMRELVAELDITEDEIHQAAAFFNRMGAENNVRTLLDATLSTASNEHLYRSRGVSHSNVEGPVYLGGAPLRPDGNLVEGPVSPDAQPFVLSGRVYDINTGAGVPGAELDIWQADHTGVYDRTGYNLRGKIVTDDEGRYTVYTVLPADYPSHFNDTITQLYAWIGRGTLRAAHVHFKVSVNGRKLLTTQVFRSDSPNLDDDLVIGIVKPELIAEVVPPAPGSDAYTMTYDIPVNLQATDPDIDAPQLAGTTA
jgi:protocatechuate 3,4-dioxygenase beta subunit